MFPRWLLTFIAPEFSVIGPSCQHFGTNRVVTVAPVAPSSLCPSVAMGGAVWCGRTVTNITHAGHHWPLMDISNLRAACASTSATCSLIITAGMEQKGEWSSVSTKILKCRDVRGCERLFFYTSVPYQIKVLQQTRSSRVNCSFHSCSFHGVHFSSCHTWRLYARHNSSRPCQTRLWSILSSFNFLFRAHVCG